MLLPDLLCLTMSLAPVRSSDASGAESLLHAEDPGYAGKLLLCLHTHQVQSQVTMFPFLPSDKGESDLLECLFQLSPNKALLTKIRSIGLGTPALHIKDELWPEHPLGSLLRPPVLLLGVLSFPDPNLVQWAFPARMFPCYMVDCGRSLQM